MQRTTDKIYRIASLFAGCGGLDLGFAGGFEFQGIEYPRLATEVVYANDFDKDAVTCFNANIPKYDKKAMCTEKDIRDVSLSEIPDYDILLAGFPCQPFSNAGLRGGVNDKYNRGTLFEECERIIRGKIDSGNKPKAFVFENVRGIMSSKMDDGTPVIDEIEKRMRRLGYLVAHRLVRASDYGVPQNRYRLLIVGIDGNLNRTFDFGMMDQLVGQRIMPSVAQGRPEQLMLGAILKNPPTSNGAGEHWAYTEATQTMIEQIGPCAHGAGAFKYFNEVTKADELPEIVFEGRSWKNIPYELLRPRFKKIADDPKRYHAPNFFRRFAFGEINGTVTASAQPENCGITHPIENRRYTVGEVGRIQSFPDAYDFGCIPLQSRYKVIGNAVPPVLAWVIAKSLLSQIDGATNE